MSYSDDVLGRFIQWSLSQRTDSIGQFYAELQTDDLYHLVDHLSVAHLYALFCQIPPVTGHAPRPMSLSLFPSLAQALSTDDFFLTRLRKDYYKKARMSHPDSRCRLDNPPIPFYLLSGVYTALREKFSQPLPDYQALFSHSQHPDFTLFRHLTYEVSGISHENCASMP